MRTDLVLNKSRSHEVSGKVVYGLLMSGTGKVWGE